MTRRQRITLTVFAVAVLLSVPIVSRGAEDADTKAIRQMFSRIDLDYPGLDQVKAALDRDDLPTANAAYLEFWRMRKDRRVLWNTEFRLHSMKMRNGAASDFFRDPAPRTISWRDREQIRGRLHLGNTWEYVDTLTDWTLLEMSDLMLEDQLVHIRMGSFLPPMKMGSPWNWSARENDDFYTTRFIHRHYFLPVLAQAYWATGDHKYVRKLVELWTDWIRRAPQPKKDEGLGPMYQALLQPATLEMIVESPELRPADFCLMLAYLTDQSLVRMTGPPRGGNQTIGQVNAILAVASAVPEFKDSAQWRELAIRYLTDFARTQCYPDGGLAETTFLYSAGTALALLTCVDSLKGMGIEAPPELAGKTEKWGEHFLHCARPDGLLPWTGHGARVEAHDLLAQIARLHPRRRDFLYYATSGREGAPPERSSAWFPWSGYSVMRDRYSPDANYLFFDVGPCGTFHRNADKLSIVVASHGRAMLEDQGIHTYTTKLPQFRTLCDYSYGHNTVIVDGLSQTMPNEIATKPGDNPWVSNAVLDFSRGVYEGPYTPTNYTQPATGGDPAPLTSLTHQRSVVFVKPDYWIITDWMLPKLPDGSAAEHTYEQLFHFIPCQVESDSETLAAWSATPDEPNLALIPLAHDELSIEIARGRRQPYLQGWSFPGGKSSQNPAPVPAPCVVYSQKTRPPALFQTILWPQRRGEVKRPRVEPYGKPASGCVRITLPDGRVDLFCCPSARGAHRVGDVTFDGLAALVRLTTSGEPTTSHVVNGRLSSYGAVLPKTTETTSKEE